MLDIFADYLNSLQTEIAQYEEKLQQKKREAERLNSLQSQVEQALETLLTVGNAIRGVDEQAMIMLQEAALSLFEPTLSEIEDAPIKTSSQEESEPLLAENQSNGDIEQNLSAPVVSEPQSQTVVPKKTPQKGFRRKQRVKVISAQVKELAGQIGEIVSMDNDDSSYVQFENGITKFFWNNQLQPT